MKVIVTGCSGYLGSILTRKLIEKKIHVIGYDAGIYGLDGIKEVMNNSKFEYIEADIRDSAKISGCMKDVDAIIHLSGIVGAPAVQLDKQKSLEINEMATRNIASLAQSKGINRFIFASSCSVYGDSKGVMLTESSPVNPLEDYAKSKYKSEKEILQVHDSPTILRFGTLMGLSPRMRFDLVVNKFIAEAHLKGMITVNGGEQMRPFLHVLDAADSILLALGEQMDGVYNVLTENFSIRGLAHIIQRLSGCKIEVNNQIGDNRNYQASINKISRFGFDLNKSPHCIEFTYNQITNWLDMHKIDIKDPKYSNYDSLLLKKS